MLVSGTQRLATRFGLKARNIITSDMYKNIFPHVELDPSSHAKTEFSFTSGGNAFYNSVGGQITGRGAHLFILDDLIPGAKEADSEVTMENLRDWYYEECYNRLMSDDVTPHGRIVLIGTRWRTNDIQGWLLDKEEQEEVDDWHIFRFPAIAEEDEEFRKEGEALWPDKYSTETLNKIRNKQARVFNGAFQQNPTIETGNIVQREWLNVEKVDETELIPPRILSLDTAFKEGMDNDYSAATVLQRTKTGVVVLYSEKRRLNFPSLLEWTIALARIYGIQGIVIEDKASGQSLIQTLRDKTKLPVVAIPIKRNEDKVSRLHAIVPYLESKRVTIHKFTPASNRDALITELLEFPLGAHDDQVDSFVHGVTYLLRPSGQLKRMGRKGLTPDVDIYTR
jgi:predicted phage terminase large subunit-like protein